VILAKSREYTCNKNSEEMSQMELDLAGKTGNILSGEADAIGYVYREGPKTYISFEGGDNIVREARSPHLRNKKFVIADSSKGEPEFDASQLFI
jgi:hypothetical protein